MQAVKATLFSIGVSLVVAPIFSFQSNSSNGLLTQVANGVVPQAQAQAQSGNQQVQMLMQMQALQAEVAELRDMVERQQFQMRKMNRTIDSLSSKPSTVNSPNTVPSYTAAPLPQASSAELLSNEYIVQGSQVQDDQPTVQQPFYPSEQTLANPNQDVGYTSNSALGQQQGAPVVSSSEYDLQQLAARAAQAGNESLAPVVDRSIGAVSNTVGSAPQLLEQEDAGAALTTSRLQVVPEARDATQQLPIEPAPIVESTLANSAAQGASATIGSIPIPQSAVSQTAGGTEVEGGISSAALSESVVVASDGGLGVAAAEIKAPELSEQDFYQSGFDYLKESKHQLAVDTFKKQIKHYPSGDFADDAHYWIAESKYVNRSLDESKSFFRAIIDGFPKSPRLPDAMLKTAYIEQDQGNQIEARILLQEIIQYHPRSNAAISAKNRLAELDG